MDVVLDTTGMWLYDLMAVYHDEGRQRCDTGIDPIFNSRSSDIKGIPDVSQENTLRIEFLF